MSDSTVTNDVHSSSSENYQWLIKIKNAGTEETTHDDNQRKGPDHFPRVPPTLRDIQQNRDCYDPSVVSIGPYHHGKTKALEEMEKFKETYALDFVKDCKKLNAVIDSEVEAMLSIAKNWYPEDARENFNDEQLAKMMFLDGCFIVQFLFCLYMKPENLKMSSHDAALSLRKKITKIFRELPKSLTIRNPQGPAPAQPAAHLPELLHKQFCSGTIVSENSEKNSCKNNSQMNWYRYCPAEELRNIGIHFKPSKTGLFTDVHFKRGWLIILIF
ncbi:uncharacterized protein [Populus alba]|uniref:uncharacterized protein n=1 Tax=Populus alba TaxID=43335 RepID=UPI003CC72B3A